MRSRQTSVAVAGNFSEKSGRPTRFRALHFLHTLHLFGAAGIATFGWAWAHRLHFASMRYLPLWFFGALLIYNFDRLIPDPADVWNLPHRRSAHLRLRRTALVLTTGSALALIATPLLVHDRWLFLSVFAAGVGSLSYSWPIFGVRVKDLPLVKTLFVPTIVTLACFFPLFRMRLPSPVELLAIAWAWIFLLGNMTLCDLRDLPGDLRCGTASLPALLGEKTTRRLLWIFAALLAALGGAGPWRALAVTAPLYLIALLVALRQPRGESFYEWFVEGMLFLPALVLPCA